MRPQHIMFMGLILAVGTIISLTFAGVWLGQEEVGLASSVAVFKQVNILGIWSVMVPNISFFITGAKALVMMDFAFFQGSWAIVQWILYLVLGLALLWGIFSIVIVAIQGLFSRR